MPLENLLTVTLLFLAGALVYRFKDRILGPLRRFEARNAQRRADEVRALFDRNAHYRQTLQIAEEQIEPVEKIEVPDERTGQPVTRFLFQGGQYASLADAEAARYAEVVGKAREFYIDLDRNWLPRGRRYQSLEPSLPPPDTLRRPRP
jgi:hypothetical protein